MLFRGFSGADFDTSAGTELPPASLSHPETGIEALLVTAFL